MIRRHCGYLAAMTGPQRYANYVAGTAAKVAVCLTATIARQGIREQKLRDNELMDTFLDASAVGQLGPMSIIELRLLVAWLEV